MVTASRSHTCIKDSTSARTTDYWKHSNRFASSGSQSYSRFACCPALLVVTDTFEITGSLGANPIEEIQDRLGNWGLRFIMIALAVTPLRRLSGWNWLPRFRRMLGLFAFFYVLMHFLAWLILDQGILWSAITSRTSSSDLSSRSALRRC